MATADAGRSMTAPRSAPSRPATSVAAVPDHLRAGGGQEPREATAPEVTGQFPPIGDLAFLSDGEAAGLVASDGNVEWLCLPDLDSPSVFGALLDRGAGRFRVGPASVLVPAGQRYLLASMVMETTWMTRSGLLVVR